MISRKTFLRILKPNTPQNNYSTNLAIAVVQRYRAQIGSPIKIVKFIFTQNKNYIIHGAPLYRYLPHPTDTSACTQSTPLSPVPVPQEVAVASAVAPNARVSG